MSTRQRYAYFYLMQGRPEQIRATAPAHAAYWKERRLEGYQGGPFADRSGGLVIFVAEDGDEAAGLVSSDPFVLQDLIGDRWIKEWMVG